MAGRATGFDWDNLSASLARRLGIANRANWL